jgi:hypothetical protein
LLPRGRTRAAIIGYPPYSAPSRATRTHATPRAAALRRTDRRGVLAPKEQTMSPTLAGALVLGLPLVFLAWALLWRRLRPVFFFALAAIVVALDYLAATGATADIAGWVLPSRFATAPPAPR